VLKQGNRVQVLTKKVGQAPRTGIVLGVRGNWVDVRWDDGRVTTVTGNVLTRIRNGKR
jgi:hypothetical protein